MTFFHHVMLQLDRICPVSGASFWGDLFAVIDCGIIIEMFVPVTGGMV